MVEFRSDNGGRGVERVARNATGYFGYVYNPGNPNMHSLEEDGAILTLARGVEDTGEPYIEVDLAHVMTHQGQDVAVTLIKEAFAQKGLEVHQAQSTHGEHHLTFHIHHNGLGDAFEALLLVNLPNGHPLIPDAYRNFVVEQQQVRHGLEQSLLHAFGEDMYARVKPAMRNDNASSMLPKSEVNRIARLVEYFRNGVPEMRDKMGKFVDPLNSKNDAHA